jgi:hypothetical protein
VASISLTTDSITAQHAPKTAAIVSTGPVYAQNATLVSFRLLIHAPAQKTTSIQATVCASHVVRTALDAQN